MKICNNCNSVQPDNSLKCSVCGRTSLREASIDTEDLDELFNAEREGDRKKKIGLSLLVLFVILLLLIAVTVVKLSQDTKNGLNSYGNVNSPSQEVGHLELEDKLNNMLNDRQLRILEQEGLSTDYNYLSPSQQRNIIRIEEMLSYADKKYGESFSYSGYIEGNTLENETTIAFPNSNPDNVFEITTNKLGFEDTYMNIFIRDDFLAYLEENTKTILPNVEFRLYGDIINASFDKKQESDYDFKGKVDGAFLIFIDDKTFGNNDIHQFELDFSNFMREQSLFGSLQVILIKNYDIENLSSYNYTDYLEENYYSYRDTLYFNKAQ